MPATGFFITMENVPAFTVTAGKLKSGSMVLLMSGP